VNRTHKVWDDLTGQHAAGINTLTLISADWAKVAAPHEKLTLKKLAQLRTSERFAHT